jgi:hypothetical protein
MSIDLYTTLKSSYGDKKAMEKLKNSGYNYDKMLSNKNQQVWFNPNENKLLYNIAGTHNMQDWGTDGYLLLGKLKDTNRYKEAKNILNQAKQKYNVNNATITGHSLGSTIGNYVSSKNDKFYGLDGGYTFFQPTRSKNKMNYRTSGDLVSLLGSNSKNIKTLSNPNLITGNLPIDILNSHNIENIKNSKINI